MVDMKFKKKKIPEQVSLYFEHLENDKLISC